MIDENMVEDLWPFVLRVYKAKGVQSACLHLQEKFLVDIPILLFSAWLGQRAILLDDRTIRQIDSSVFEWRTDIIMVLRQVRQRLKTGPSPAPTPATEPLRDAVKAAELAAERIELSLMEEIARKMYVNSDVDQNTLVTANLKTVVSHFRNGPQNDLGEPYLLTIAAAV